MTNVALLLIALLLATPEQLPQPPASDEPTAGELAVSDTVLGAAQGKQVEITTREGGTTVGTLETFGDDVVVLVLSDGRLVEVQRSMIESVKIAATESTPPPLAPPPVATAIAMCMGDESCEDPRVCIEGQCRVPVGYTDELRDEAAPRIKHGRWMMIAGAATLGVGLIIISAGFGAMGTCSGAENFEALERCEKRSLRAYDAGFAGVGVAAAGAVLLIIGGGTYGMGKNKLKRADRHDKQLGFSVELGRRGLGLAVQGRF